jgi:Na+/proline symporter
MSLVFGVITQLVFWDRATRWLWLIASAASFVLGLVISEVWFGWATEAELQPNIDGLSLDEVFLGFVVGLVIVLLARFVTRARSHRPLSP